MCEQGTSRSGWKPTRLRERQPWPPRCLFLLCLHQPHSHASGFSFHVFSSQICQLCPHSAAAPGLLRAPVLPAGHHGGRTSLSAFRWLMGEGRGPPAPPPLLGLCCCLHHRDPSFPCQTPILGHPAESRGWGSLDSGRGLDLGRGLPRFLRVLASPGGQR